MTDPEITSEAEVNRAVIRRVFQAWQDGTGVIADVFAPDMVWRIEGHSISFNDLWSRVRP